MKIAAIIAISYLISGAHFVWADMRQPVYNQWVYVRSLRLSEIALVIFAWLPSALWVLKFAGYRLNQGRQVIRSLEAVPLPDTAG
jgi:hypothetical protein